MNDNPITALVAVPYGKTRKHKIFSFSDRVCLVKTRTSATEVFLYGPDGLGQISGVDMATPGYEKWATTVFEGRIYFTCPSVPIHVVTEAPYVLRLGNQNVLTAATKNIPAAQFIETFFDHLVVGNVSFNGEFPSRVQWSHLRNFGIWEPSKNVEADFYDFIESQDGTHAGVTGLRKLGSYLAAYTSNSIWLGQYVGLPGVIKWHDAVKEIGNEFPYSLVDINTHHIFISEQWQNFAWFAGQGTPEPIGDAIAPFFFGNLTTDPEYRYRTHGYLDKKNREAVWAFVSKESTGEFDLEVVFSLRDKTWYTRQCFNAHSFCNGGRCGVAIHDLGVEIDQLPGTINSLGQGDTFDRLWADGDGNLLEESSGAGALNQTPPVLETHDLIYGDLQAFKELESMCVQAQLGTAAGLEVYLSIRKNLSDPVEFVKVDQNWIPELREGRLSLPRKSGRIVRYRFTVPETNLDNFAWQTFIENVYGAKQVEK